MSKDTHNLMLQTNQEANYPVSLWLRFTGENDERKLSHEWKSIGKMEVKMLLLASLKTSLIKYFSIDVSLVQKKQKVGKGKLHSSNGSAQGTAFFLQYLEYRDGISLGFFQGIQISSMSIHFLSTIKLPENLRLLTYLAHFIPQKQIMLLSSWKGQYISMFPNTEGIWGGAERKIGMFQMNLCLKLSLLCISVSQQRQRRKQANEAMKYY